MEQEHSELSSNLSGLVRSLVIASRALARLATQAGKSRVLRWMHMPVDANGLLFLCAPLCRSSSGSTVSQLSSSSTAACGRSSLVTTAAAMQHVKPCPAQHKPWRHRWARWSIFSDRRSCNCVWRNRLCGPLHSECIGQDGNSGVWSGTQAACVCTLYHHSSASNCNVAAAAIFYKLLQASLGSRSSWEELGCTCWQLPCAVPSLAQPHVQHQQCITALVVRHRSSSRSAPLSQPKSSVAHNRIACKAFEF